MMEDIIFFRDWGRGGSSFEDRRIVLPSKAYSAFGDVELLIKWTRWVKFSSSRSLRITAAVPIKTFRGCRQPDPQVMSMTVCALLIFLYCSDSENS